MGFGFRVREFCFRVRGWTFVDYRGGWGGKGGSPMFGGVPVVRLLDFLWGKP